MSARLYLEGGGDNRELRARCREAFRRLLEASGFEGRMPRLVASGGRDATYNDFHHAHETAEQGEFVGLLVDSEDPVANIEETWAHLWTRDQWPRPNGAEDEQVFLMTTSMETWIIADRAALKAHFGQCLRETALMPLVNLEKRARHDVLNALVSATGACGQGYAKGDVSFRLLGSISPSAVARYLPSLVRMQRILNSRL